MELDDYQRRAADFDQVPDGPDALVVPLLGLAGEAGELLSEYKRNLRARRAHEAFPAVESAPNETFPEVVMEELGDILWYAANLATKFSISLDEIANTNLAKLGDRYNAGEQLHFFDEQYPEEERIPRQFEVLFIERIERGRTKVLLIRGDGKTLGNELTDNAHADDGYRYHDVFHLSYATMLGWSPVTRKFMRVKRASNAIADEIEDGGRSWVFEEAIALMVFEAARRNKFFRGRASIDGRLLRDIKSLTAGLEVRSRSRREWELAIQEGYDVWHKLRTNHGGWVSCDLRYRSMKFRKATPSDTEAVLTLAGEYDRTQVASLKRAEDEPRLQSAR